MNIKPYINRAGGLDYVSPASSANPSRASAGRLTCDFDRVSLKESSHSPDDASFARALAHETAVKLEAGAGRERILSLRQQIEAGTYTPDSRRIAEHMLGYR